MSGENYYFIEEQIRTARHHLPRGYSRELPRLKNEPNSGTPRVYDPALEFISQSHGWIDIDSLRSFIASYQAECLLSLGELWATPIMLRLALLENLRRVMASLLEGQRDRARAAYWADKLLSVAGSQPARVVLAALDRLLVRRDLGLIQLFAPPFDTSTLKPGYGRVTCREYAKTANSTPTQRSWQSWPLQNWARLSAHGSCSGSSTRCSTETARPRSIPTRSSRT